MLLPVVASSADGSSHAAKNEERGSDDDEDDADAVEKWDVGQGANDDEDYSGYEHKLPIRFGWFCEVFEGRAGPVTVRVGRR